MMESKLFLWLLSSFLSQVDRSICGSFVEFSSDAKTPAQYQPPFYPYSISDCVCSKNSRNSFLQCEGKFLVTSSTRYRYINVNCNTTLASSDLRHDYPNLIGLKSFVSYSLHWRNCPEPMVSYAKQIFPSKEEKTRGGDDDDGVNAVVKTGNNIRELHIQCASRKKFTIAKKHLESLSGLISFSVSCLALKNLPSDVFQGTIPNVETIFISGTQVAEIPGGIFRDLKKLANVVLTDNFIKRMNGDAFLGCEKLSMVNVERNRLSLLEEKLLDTLENITHLYVSGNSLKEIPKNLRNLRKLKVLDLSHNRLQRMDEEHCDGFSNIEHLNISYNEVTRFHSKCFPRNIHTLDISGNFLRNITNEPKELNELLKFYFHDNSVSHFDIKTFLNSSKLFTLHMANSNVISVDSKILSGIPNLWCLDFSYNGISSIPKNLFVKNTRLTYIYLQRNKISSIPPGLFRKNKGLYHVDLSWNRIGVIPIYLFPQYCLIWNLDFSFNRIKNIPVRFLANMTSLRSLNLSKNSITSLGKDFFMEMLDHPLKFHSNLRILHLQGNRMSSLPVLRLENLEYLDVSRNKLRNTWNNLSPYLPLVKEIYLSNNSISHFPLFDIFKTTQELETLDLSYNKLIDFPPVELFKALPTVPKLKSIDLSKNRFRFFYVTWIEFAQNLEKLNLSYNNIDKFCSIPDCNSYYPRKMTRLKVLDVSNNDLHLNYSSIEFNPDSLTWGRVSPFNIFPNLEELHLRNNSISTICLDWRLNMPNLKFLDLRDNKLRYLNHQDMIFKSVSVDEKIRFGPYHWPHKFTVDLRHNHIRFVELPQRMLAFLPKKNETKGAYGHVTILIEDNPFECGCSVFNLLRVIRYDVVLTTQLKRVTGKDGVYPAKLEVGSLSCSTPETVRGKKINNTEEWLHHLIPLFGICTLADVF